MTATACPHFEKEKQARIGADDLSKKGSLDEPIVNLINWINDNELFFSTSSCSGRVICYETAIGSKSTCRFLRVFHTSLSPANVEDVVSINVFFFLIFFLKQCYLRTAVQYFHIRFLLDLKICRLQPSSPVLITSHI